MSSGVFSGGAAAARNKSGLLLSFPQLLQRVQASETELRAELAARGAFSWNKNGRSGSGKSGSGEKENGGDDDERQAKRSKASPSIPAAAVRVLDPSFEASMLDFLLLTAAARGWRPHALPTEDLVRAMVSSPSSSSSLPSSSFDGEEREHLGGGGGYDEGIVRHSLWRWSGKRTEGGRNGMRASDDGGGGGGAGGGNGGGGGGGETPGGTAPASQGGKSPLSSSAAAAVPLFDEDLHEASAEAFLRAKRPALPALLSLDAATVLRHEARKLLMASPTWPERGFSAAWREALERLGVDVSAVAASGSSSVSLDLSAATSGGGALAGLATLLPPPPQQQRSNNVSEKTVLRLDASALPRDPRSRFAALFAAKARWLKAEIAPYLVGAAVAPGTPGGMGALLLAHARASQAEPDAPVFFSAR